MADENMAGIAAKFPIISEEEAAEAEKAEAGEVEAAPEEEAVPEEKPKP